MDIGDYVRTKNKVPFEPSQIAKITDMKKDEGYKNQYFITLDHNLPTTYNFHIYSEDVIKSNPNIIDLIEPQDLLYIDIDDGYAGGIIVPRIPETQAELDKMIELIKNNTWILKGIVTHEQLEEMEYKL